MRPFTSSLNPDFNIQRLKTKEWIPEHSRADLFSLSLGRSLCSPLEMHSRIIKSHYTFFLSNQKNVPLNLKVSALSCMINFIGLL